MAERLRRQLMESQPDWFPTQENPRFGPPAKYPIFTVFNSRADCARAGVHATNYAGICGTVTDGAFSICMSGGYQDDKDKGDYIFYTGTGGQENSFSGAGGKQISDQSFDHPDNAALLKSMETKRPVRVIRGFKCQSPYAPAEGYRYDGLYVVEKAYMDKSEDSGYKVCTFELRRVEGQPRIPKRRF